MGQTAAPQTEGASSWSPVVAIPMVMWLFGQDPDRTTAAGAVLLAPAASVCAGIACATMAVIASVGYLGAARGGGGSHYGYRNQHLRPFVYR